MISCPRCGRATPEGAFCSRCGAELDSAPAPVSPAPAYAQPQRTEFHRTEQQVRQAMDEGLRLADERIRRFDVDERMRPARRGEPTLEIDSLCPLFENLNSTLRFRFDPHSGGEPLEAIAIVFSNCACDKKPVQRIRRVVQTQEFPVQSPPQSVGMQSWNVAVEYVSAGRRRKLAGDFSVIVKPVESRAKGENISINIATNIGNVSQASDVTVNQRGAEGLADLIAATNPFEEMQRVFMSGKRQWTAIPLLDDDQVADLPPVPANAQTEHILVDLGGDRRIHFFAHRTITFGRKKETNDIVLRPAPGADDRQMIPYCKISREHCFFEHSGEKALIVDGRRNPAGVVEPSTGGTFWNDERLEAPLELSAGTAGVVSFGGVQRGENLALDVKVCEPVKACATCPHANVRWCGEGRRPCLMFSRRDGLPEKFVGLWSCFCLGEADPSFEGVVIFRKDGAFAYRRNDGRSGWLVPGTRIQTDFGFVDIN
ncbi:MAG: FHA domain-containing protein [Kiritimatiellia bacterium]